MAEGRAGPLVLLDRDGTLNHDTGYIAEPGGIELLPGVIPGLRALHELGCTLVIATNQSGVARGYFTRAQAEAVNARVVALLHAAGIPIRAAGLCPHGPDDGCRCRKPNSGLAEEVAWATGLSLRGAIVIGDKASDIGLARGIGAWAVLVHPEPEGAPDHGQDATVPDIVGAAEAIRRWLVDAAPRDNERIRKPACGQDPWAV